MGSEWVAGHLRARWHHEEQTELPGARRADESKAGSHPEFRIIGGLSRRYALLEGEEGLVLFEPRAGLERIYYERLLNEEEEIESQSLLVPVLVELNVRDVDLLMRHQKFFEQAGFSLESFGGQTVTLAAAPSFLAGGEVKSSLLNLVDQILDREGETRVRRLAYEAFAAKVAGVAARREEWRLAALPALLTELFDCDLPYCGPAGKPTLVQISFQELDRKFGNR